MALRWFLVVHYFLCFRTALLLDRLWLLDRCTVRPLRFAFGNKVALTVDPVNIEATCASALPKKPRAFSGAPITLHARKRALVGLYVVCGGAAGFLF